MRLTFFQNLVDYLRGKHPGVPFSQQCVSYWDRTSDLMEPCYLYPEMKRLLFRNNAHFHHAFGLAFSNLSVIGEHVTFFQEVSLANKNECGPTIGDYCILYPKSSVLGGVTLGHHCVVGNLSVVTKSFPAYSVLAGNPARLIRTLTPEEWESEFREVLNERPSWKELLTKHSSLLKKYRYLLKKELKSNV